VSDRLALANAIEDAGIERGKAERVASVIFDAIHDNVATKADVQASEASIRSQLQAAESSIRSQLQTSEATLRSEIAPIRTALVTETARLDAKIDRLDATVKAQPNAVMLRLGALMVVLTGIIIAALRYLPPPHP
jgi:hypothetical protein